MFLLLYIAYTLVSRTLTGGTIYWLGLNQNFISVRYMFFKPLINSSNYVWTLSSYNSNMLYLAVLDDICIFILTRIKNYRFMILNRLYKDDRICK